MPKKKKKKRKPRKCRICKKRPVWTRGDVKAPGPFCKRCYHKHVWSNRPAVARRRQTPDATADEIVPALDAPCDEDWDWSSETDEEPPWDLLADYALRPPWEADEEGVPPGPDSTGDDEPIPF